MPTSFSSTLQSFIAGRWQGLHGVQPLRSALNGQTLTYIHSEPLDFAEVLEHGRNVGVGALMALDFQQRAARLKALALYLKQHKEKLYAMSYYTGATRNDSWIDIEGGISTLFSYASQGARGLPSGNIYHEGPPCGAGCTGPFYGHAYFGASGWRCRAHQRLQLSGVGFAGKICPQLSRRGAMRSQTCDLHQLPGPRIGAIDGRIGSITHGQSATDYRRHG